MVLCLALQLAEQLIGFADLLVPVVAKHKDAAHLTLAFTFDL